MASGHVNRTNRPNTWLLRPPAAREESSCQPGAVHTWPKAEIGRRSAIVGYLGYCGQCVPDVPYRRLCEWRPLACARVGCRERSQRSLPFGLPSCAIRQEQGADATRHTPRRGQSVPRPGKWRLGAKGSACAIMHVRAPSSYHRRCCRSSFSTAMYWRIVSCPRTKSLAASFSMSERR
jgi:hypothetical protein